jgi:hypothetical protein
MKPRPFKVYKQGDWWVLERRPWAFGHVTQRQLGFKTAGDAIDYAYKHWPWWL